MALKSCKECNCEVSSLAESCPNCGARLKRKPIGCLGGIFILIVISMVATQVSQCHKDSLEKEQAARQLEVQRQASERQQAEKSKFEADIAKHHADLANLMEEKQYDKALGEINLFTRFDKAGYGDVEKFRKIARTGQIEEQMKNLSPTAFEENLKAYKELLALNPENQAYKKKIDIYQKKFEKNQEEREKQAYKASCQLEVLKGTWSVEYDYAIYEGQVKNISDSPMKNVLAVVTWFDKNDQMITSSSSLIQYNPILPGQTSPFKVMKSENPAMNKASVEFSYLMGGTINSYREK